MSLTTCRECGKEVSSEASTCPHCGINVPGAKAPSTAPAPEGNPKVLVAICLVVIVAATIGSMLRSKEPKPPAPATIAASVTFTGTQFQIINADNFSWIDCRFQVNSKYEYRKHNVPPGTLEVGAMQFTDDDGKRFNPFDYAAKQFSANCTTPDGRPASWYGGWN